MELNSHCVASVSENVFNISFHVFHVQSYVILNYIEELNGNMEKKLW